MKPNKQFHPMVPLRGPAAELRRYTAHMFFRDFHT